MMEMAAICRDWDPKGISLISRAMREFGKKLEGSIRAVKGQLYLQLVISDHCN